MTNISPAYKKHFPSLSDQQITLLSKAEDLYLEWNEKINVISRKDTEQNIRVNHFFHSLSIAKYANISTGDIVLDVGTGGGFPGIPLAIMYPEAKFILVDSIQKKIKVVNELSIALGLENVTTKWARVEELNLAPSLIISRAVKRLKIFLPWIENHFKTKNFKGLFYLKGGDLTEEIKEVSKKYSSKKYLIAKDLDFDFFETKMVLKVMKK